VLIVGGASAFVVTNTALIFDPATSAFSPTNPMSFARANHAATLLPTGAVLVAGGSALTNELYTPGVGWTNAGALPQIRDNPAFATLADGRILFAGGAAATPAFLFDSTTSSWTSLPAPAPLHGSTGASLTALLDGRALLAGGGSTPVTSVHADLFVDG